MIYITTFRLDDALFKWEREKTMLPNEVIYQSVSFLLIWKWHVFPTWCTDMRFNSFLSDGFNTFTIVKPPDKRRVNPTFVPCSLVQWIKNIFDSTIQLQFLKKLQVWLLRCFLYLLDLLYFPVLPGPSEPSGPFRTHGPFGPSRLP